MVYVRHFSYPATSYKIESPRIWYLADSSALEAPRRAIPDNNVSLIRAAVYLGYLGDSYIQRGHWHRPIFEGFYASVRTRF